MFRKTVRAALPLFLFVAGFSAVAQATEPAENELQRTLAEVDRIISDSESTPLAEDKAEWRTQLSDVLRHWAEFRDARCDARLIGFEQAVGDDAAGAAAARCREGFDRTVLADIRYRYSLADEAPRRPSLDPAVDARPFYPEEPDSLDCDPPPPAECDYCGVNVCWERELARDDRELNAVWRRVLAGIGRQSGLDRIARADWVERLRRSQRAWLLLRDDNCHLESWETPNRQAHSIYATQWAPCVHAETQARIAWLGTRYPGGATDAARLTDSLSIPAEFHGRWAETVQLCAEPDGPVEVRADGIDFFAAAIRPIAAAPSADGFAFTSRTEEEGETLREAIALRRDGARLVVARDGVAQSYVRCGETEGVPETGT